MQENLCQKLFCQSERGLSPVHHCERVCLIIYVYGNERIKLRVKTVHKFVLVPHRKELTSETLRRGSRSFYAANTPHLPLTRKHSPDGATTDSSSSHLIAFINPDRMKG